MKYHIVLGYVYMWDSNKKGKDWLREALGLGLLPLVGRRGQDGAHKGLKDGSGVLVPELAGGFLNVHFIVTVI